MPWMIKATSLHCWSNDGVFFTQANCIDCTQPAEAVFASEVEKLRLEQFKGAGDPGALRARPRLRRRRLQDAQEAKAISIRKFLSADTYMNVGACDRFYSYLVWSLHRSLNKVLSRSWLNNHELALPRSFHLGINVREIRPIFRRSDLH